MQKLLATIKMKKLLILFLFISAVSFSQEKVIELDYFVDYVVPGKRQKNTDTITIGFNKDGKYLWTNYNKLALNLAKSLVKDSSKDYTKAESNIIYDTEEGTLLMTFEFDNNLIFFNLNIDSFLPKTNNNDKDESLDLITEDIGETTEVLGREVDMHNIFPSDKPNDVLTIATDKEFNVNNTAIFKKLFEIAFMKKGIKNDNLPEFPEGLIMKIIIEENTLIEAINVDNTKKTLTINHSFKITE